MTIKTLFQLCAENRDICLQVFRDRNLEVPVALRRKIAVLTIERILIENALKRRNTYLEVPYSFHDEYRHLGVVKHGVFIASKTASYPGRVCFYWFGKKHGLSIRNIRSRNVPFLRWYKMAQRHGLQVHPITHPTTMAGQFKVEKYHQGVKIASEVKSIDIPSVIKNGCSTRFTQLIGAKVHQVSLELGYWSV